MRSADVLISDLNRLGARLTANGDKMRVDAPKGILTEDVRMELSRNKSEILRLLQSESAPTENQDHNVIDGHQVKWKVWETEKAIVFEDTEGRFWRYLHGYGKSWPVVVLSAR